MSVLEPQTKPTVFSQGGPGEEFAPYRAVSKAAVMSLFIGLLTLLPGALWMAGLMALLVLVGFVVATAAAYRFHRPLALVMVGLTLLVFLPGGIGLLSLTGPVVLSFPLLGALLGLIGYRNIRRYPAELTGKLPALGGLALCVSLVLGGAAGQAWLYATEVPEGYRRVAFETLKAPSGKADVPPPGALALDGERVFIRAYIYPGQQRLGLKQFVLVPDLGTCCFGGSPKLTHMIEVTLSGDQTVDYSMTKRRLGGILKVNESLQAVPGRPGVYYQLEADYAK